MNTLSATLTAITATDRLACVSAAVGGDTFHLLLAEPFHESPGTPLTLAFKETEVILALAETPCTANGAYGTIRSIRKGTVLSEIGFEYGGTLLHALVPTLTFDPLGMDIGMQISWAVQPGEISLIRENHGN